MFDAEKRDVWDQEVGDLCRGEKMPLNDHCGVKLPVNFPADKHLN